MDRSDPAVRARARFDTRWSHELRWRITTAALLVLGALAGPFVAAPATGDPGATVGALVASALFVALAVAVWPHEWSAEEREHLRLEAMWCELCTDADDDVAWERFAAWAEAEGGEVDLMLLSRVPTTARRVGGAPSPYRIQVLQRLDADDVAAAAEVMERLRDKAAERELQDRRRRDREHEQALRLEHERRLRAIDEATAAEQTAQQEQLERELAAQQDAERRAQAQAVARALRRP